MAVEVATRYVRENTACVASTMRHRKIQLYVEFLQHISKAAMSLAKVSIESYLNESRSHCTKAKFSFKYICDKYKQIRK